MAVLVVLAAGLGRRFGAGTKQLTAIGPAGETIVDYTMRDATAAGFSRAVVIVRPDIAEEAASHIAKRAGLPTEYVEQLEPSGTADAVLVARVRVGGDAFAVVNADDYYGTGALTELRARLDASSDPGDEAFAVLYRVDDTLPRDGAVTRGLCRVEGTRVRALDETVISRAGSGISTADGAAVASDALVSMNLWGFRPAIFDAIERADRPPGREFRLPDFVDAQLRTARLRVTALVAPPGWFGITRAADVDAARASAAALGVVPER